MAVESKVVIDTELFQQIKVKEMMASLSTYHDLVCPLLECLHCLTKELPNSPLGKKVHLCSYSSQHTNFTILVYLDVHGIGVEPMALMLT